MLALHAGAAAHDEQRPVGGIALDFDALLLEQRQVGAARVGAGVEQVRGSMFSKD